MKSNRQLASQVSRSVTASILILFGALITSQSSAQQINWQGDLQSAVSEAKSQDKLVMMHFGASWCRPCRNLDTFVFSNPIVQREFNANVVGVKIDADVEKGLVQEYGVSKLPFDIVMTPGGRVVLKRSSPVNATSYAKMLSGLERVVNSLAEGKDPALKQSLAEIDDRLKTPPKFDGQPVSFTPDMPSHNAPQYSQESAQLQRRAKAQVVRNPYAEATPMQAPAAPPQKIENAFAPMKPEPFQAIQAPQQSPSDQYKVAPNEPHEAPETGSLNLQPVDGQLAVTTNEFVPQVMPRLVTKPAMQPNQVKLPEAPVVPRDLALKRLDQSEVAARLVREKAEQNRRDFDATAKIVMNDKFFGQATPQQVASNGNYQAKITLPQEAVVPTRTQVAESHEFQPEQPIVRKQSRIPTMMASSSKTFRGNSRMEAGLSEAARKPAQTQYALHGKCPVTLLTEARWEDGNDQWGCIHRNRIYIFSSAENLATFQGDPDGYSPVLAGYDPVLFKETGKLVDGKEEFGVFMGKAPRQRIVLFANFESRTRFQENPRKYLEVVREAMRRSGDASSELMR